MNQLLEQFKTNLISKGASKLTVKNYIVDIKKFVNWYEAKYQKTFEPQDITQFVLDEFKKDKTASVSARSVERYLSSLRKFFTFLKDQNIIPQSPFEIGNLKFEIGNSDPWKIKEFKDYLYVFGSSDLTIKNYILDIQDFKVWCGETLVAKDEYLLSHSHPLKKVSPEIIEEYKDRLLNILHFAPASINRKLSSIRKYCEFAVKHGIIQVEGIQKSKIKNQSRQGGTKLKTEGTISLNDLPTTDQRPTTNDQRPIYSKIPPIRLAQKILRPFTTLEEKIEDSVANIIVKHFSKKGDSLRSATTKGVSFARNELLKRSHLSPDAYQDQGTTFKNQQKSVFSNPRVSNIPKEFYAPHAISIKNYPWHRKIVHHVKHSRPKWYKTYHSYTFSHYLHFAVLIIYASAIGVAVYQTLFANPNIRPTFAASAPPRILSFQARLTDSGDNAITNPTDLRFAIYNSDSASGAALLWQEVQYSIQPDTDGIFSVYLGNNTAIDQSVFANNDTLYLGVTVGWTAELSPRQRLAAVAYATNAELLQGMMPITAVGAGQTNVILALDSGGNLSIGGTANPTFEATGGQFKLQGQTLFLTTTAGSNGNITLNPDGTGKIDLQKALFNSSLYGTLPGAVEVRDNFMVNATDSGRAAFIVNNTGTGDLINASASGVTKFRVDSSGNASIAGTLTLAQGQALQSAYGSLNLNYKSGPDTWTTGLVIDQNGNIGIGTTNPAYKLDINGTGSFSDTLTLGSTLVLPNTNTITGNADYVDFSQGIGTGGTSRLTTAGALQNITGYIQTSGTFNVNSGMLYANTTNVGIGTTTPNALLELLGGGGTTQLRLSSTDNSVYTDIKTDQTGILSITPSGGSSTLSGNLSITGAATISGNTNISGNTDISKNLIVSGATTIGGNLKVQGSSTFSSTLSLGPSLQVDAGTCDLSSSGKMYYDAIQLKYYYCNGSSWTEVSSNFFQRNLGALAPLNITDDIVIGGISTQSAKIGFINIAAGTPTATFSSNLSLQVPTGIDPNILLNLLNGGTLNVQTSGGGDAGLISRLYLANNGNIGIGNTSPNAKFDILAGGGTTQLRLTSTDNSTYTDIKADQLGNLSINPSGGSTTISGNLKVTGAATISGNTNISGNLNTTGYTTIGASLAVGYNTVPAGIGNAIFSGQVGIGVNNPASALQIAGDILPDSTGLRSLGSDSLYWASIYVNNIFSPSEGGIAAYWQLNNGALSPAYITNSLNLGAIATTSAITHLAATASDNSFYNGTGNFGIGTANPTEKLDIAGDIQLYNSTTGRADVNTSNSLTLDKTWTTNTDFNITGTTFSDGMLNPATTNELKLASYVTGFTYRNPITINNTGNASTLTNYQASVSANTQSLINAGKMRSDCADIRFTDADGTTLVNHWVETSPCSSTSAVIWVKVPSISASSNKTIYMYYGNSSATDTASGGAVFNFFDTFSRDSTDATGLDTTTNWTITNYTGFSITSGELKGTNTTGRLTSKSTFSDGVIQEAKTRTVTRPSGGLNNASFWLSTSNGLGYLIYGTVDNYWNNGAWTGLSTLAPLNTNILTRITVRSSTIADILTYNYDNPNTRYNAAGNISNTVSNEPIVIGERQDNTNTDQSYEAYWDWIRIRQYTSVEPSTSLGTEEGAYISGDQTWTSETQDAGSSLTYKPIKFTANWTLDGSDNTAPKFQILGSSTGAFAGEETVYPAGSSSYYQNGGTYSITSGTELEVSSQVTTAFRYWRIKAYLNSGSTLTDTPKISDIRLRDDSSKLLALQSQNSQNVAIGTTSATAKLTVAGSASLSGNLILGGTTSSSYTYLDILNGKDFSIRNSVGGDSNASSILSIFNNGIIQTYSSAVGRGEIDTSLGGYFDKTWTTTTDFTATGATFSGGIMSTPNSNELSVASTTFGNGIDGAVTFTAETNITTTNKISGRSCADGGDAVNYSILGFPTSNQATLSATPSNGCLAAGDEILIINLQGTAGNSANVGKHETLFIKSISGNTITFESNKTNYYGAGAYDDTFIGTATSTQRVMLQRVPNYTTVTINSGASIKTSSWNGTKDGVLFFRAATSLTNNGTITASGSGYSSGNTYNGSTGGYQGEGYKGPGNNVNDTTRKSANFQGGGAAWDSGYNSGLAEGGGGGGYGVAGNNGTYSHSSYAGQGSGGTTYGSDNLSTLFLGSAGGAGGSGYNGSAWNQGNGTFNGKGGHGGGIIYISAKTITNSGFISATGSAGFDGWGHNGTTCSQSICGGGGGGGSGGSIYIKGDTIDLGTDYVVATGGAQSKGGGGSYGGGWNSSTGGQGGFGRVAINYITSLSGNASPSAYAIQTSNSYPSGDQLWTSETQDAGVNNNFKPTLFTANWTLDGSDNIAPKFQIHTSNNSDFTNETVYPAGATTYYQNGGTYSITSGTELDVSSQILNAFRYWKVVAILNTDTTLTDTPTIQDIRLRELDKPLVLQASSNQKVGIGTTTPNAKLDVAGSASFSGNITLAGSTSNSTTYLNLLNGNNFSIRNSIVGDEGLADLLTLLTNGNLGVGVTNPAEKLDLAGDIKLFNSSTFRADISTTDSTSYLDKTWSNNADFLATGATFSSAMQGSYDNEIQVAASTYGKGTDGDVTFTSADTDITTTNKISGRTCADGGDAVNYNVMNFPAANQATLSATPSTGCLAAGDEVLVINLQGTADNHTNVGNYETLFIKDISDFTITFTSNKTKYYGAGASDDTLMGISRSAQRVLLQRVPQYRNVTVNPGATVKTSTWDGLKGGVLFFRVLNTLTNQGVISASSSGFRGGNPHISTTIGGFQGEGYRSPGNNQNDTTRRAGNFQGGGAAWDSGYLYGLTEGGGGGGYGTGGGNGIYSNSSYQGTGQGGTTYGDQELSDLFLGSGGGSGGSGRDTPGNWGQGNGTTDGKGGHGGGILYIGSRNIVNTGYITATGSAGYQGWGHNGTFCLQYACGGGGGGGSGGSLYVTGNALTLGTDLVVATGGARSRGGNGTNGDWDEAGDGGPGGYGRIFIKYATSLSGTSTPSAYTVQDSTVANFALGEQMWVSETQDAGTGKTYKPNRFSATWQLDLDRVKPKFQILGSNTGTFTGEETVYPAGLNTYYQDSTNYDIDNNIDRDISPQVTTAYRYWKVKVILGAGSTRTDSPKLYNVRLWENKPLILQANNNQFVGIGTTAPKVMLDVAGSASFAGNLTLTGTSSGNFAYLDVLNGNSLSIRTSIGGDTSPQAALNILSNGNTEFSGNMQIYNSTTGRGEIYSTTNNFVDKLWTTTADFNTSGTSFSTGMLNPATNNELKLATGLGIYRRGITIDNTASNAALTNYQASISANTTSLINAGKLKSDCSDLRFSDSDGATRLEHWIETSPCSSTSATIWVKVPSIPASGNTTIYMYYGNSSNTSVASGGAVFDFFDDFSKTDIDTGIWNITGRQNFALVNGELLGANTTGRLTSKQTFSSNVIFETKYKTVTRASSGFMSGGFFNTTGDNLGHMVYTASNDYYSNNGWVAFPAPPISLNTNIITRITARSAFTADILTYNYDNPNTRFDVVGNVANNVSNEPIAIGERYDNSNTGQTYEAYWDWIRIRQYATSVAPTAILNDTEQSLTVYTQSDQTWTSEALDSGTAANYKPVKFSSSWTLDGSDNTTPKFQILGSNTGAFAGEETTYPAGSTTYYQDGGTYDINNNTELSLSNQITTSFRYWKVKTTLNTGTTASDTPKILDIRLRDTDKALVLQGTNGQNVAIGTTSATAKLDVNGDISSSGSLAFRGSNPTIDILNNGRLDFQGSPSGDDLLRQILSILANGYVGVGTANPFAKLQVSGGNIFLDSGYSLGISSSGTLNIGQTASTTDYTTNVYGMNAAGYSIADVISGRDNVVLLAMDNSFYNTRGENASIVYGFRGSGMFGQGIGIGGFSDNSRGTYLTFSRGSQIAGNNYDTMDANQGSISFWLKPHWAASDVTDKVIFEFPSLMRLIYNGTTSRFNFGYWNGSDFTTVMVPSLSQTFPADSWLYIVVSWDADNAPYLQIKVKEETTQKYLNGTFTAQTPSATNYIGADTNGTNLANAMLDDFIITNNVLRSTESGTISTTANSTTVTGSESYFWYLMPGDMIKFTGDPNYYNVNSIVSATSLALASVSAQGLSSVTYQAGQVTALFNGGTGQVASNIVNSGDIKFYAAMDSTGTFTTSISGLGLGINWRAYNAVSNTNGQKLTNGTMEADTSGVPDNWSEVGSPTSADAESYNNYFDTRSQKITVTGISKGIFHTANVGVTAGDRYRVQTYVKSDGTNRANLRVRNVTAGNDITTIGTINKDWTLVTTDFQIPVGAENITVYLESGTAASYVFYVDNVGLWKLP